MAGKKDSPLQAALTGDTRKLSEKETRGALTEAISKLTRVERLANVNKEAVLNTGTALLHSSETLGTLFVDGLAEGYVGRDRMQVGGVDVRAPAGLLLQGVGIYMLLNNENDGAHFLALGNGVTGSRGRLETVARTRAENKQRRDRR